MQIVKGMAQQRQSRSQRSILLSRVSGRLRHLRARAAKSITKSALPSVILVVRKDTPINSTADLIAHDRQNPGSLKFGSGAESAV